MVKIIKSSFEHPEAELTVLPFTNNASPCDESVRPSRPSGVRTMTDRIALTATDLSQ